MWFRRAWSATILSHRTNLVGAAVLLALICVSFAPFIFGSVSLQGSTIEAPSLFPTGSTYPPSALIRFGRELDPGAPAWQTEPDFVFEHNTLFTEHNAPLWNPYSAYGLPLAAETDSQPYFPVAWIPIIADSARAWNLFVVLRLYLAGLFMFLFLRQFLGFVPSLAGATAYMYSGYLLLYAAMPHISVEALIPGLLYVIERLLRHPSFSTAAQFCALFALSALGGMPESTFLAVAFALLYAAARWWGVTGFRRDFRRVVGFGALGGLLSLGISAIQLLPFAEYAPLSSTLHNSGVGSGYDLFMADRLALYVAPLLHGPPWANVFAAMQSADTGSRGFFGCAAAFFALIAVATQVASLIRRRPAFDAPVLFFGIVVVWLLAKRFGVWPFAEIGKLPGFDLIIFPKYEEAIIACAVAALAGFGVALLLERRAPLWAIVTSLAVPLLALTAAAGADKPLYRAAVTPSGFYIESLAFALAMLAAVIGLTLVVRRGALAPSTAGILAIGLIAFEPNFGYIVPLYYIVNGNGPDSASAIRGTAYVKFLRAHSGDGARFLGEGMILYPNWGAAFAISDPRALDALYPQRYLPFVAAFFAGRLSEARLSRFDGGSNIDFSAPMDRRFLDLSSVRYVGANLDLATAHGSPFRVAFEQPGATIFEYRTPLPRVAVYHRVVRVADARAALDMLRNPAFDPRSEAVVESSSSNFDVLARAQRRTVSAGRLEVYQSLYVRATAVADATTLIVLNDTAFPGWEAFVDGRQVPIVTANYLFRGLLVGPGSHVIEFHYSPSSFSRGALISLISLILLALIATADRPPLARWIRARSIAR